MNSNLPPTRVTTVSERQITIVQPVARVEIFPYRVTYSSCRKYNPIRAVREAMCTVPLHRRVTVEVQLEDVHNQLVG
jgi:hypothetical protein